MLISTDRVKAGDIFDRIVNGEGKHVMLIGEVYQSSAAVIHAVVNSFADGTRRQRVTRENIAISGDYNGVIRLWDATYNKDFSYKVYSPFPQFTWSAPAKDNPGFNPLTQAIELTIRSKTKIKVSGITLVLDGDLPAATTIQAGAPGLTFAPEVDATDIAVHYAIPADFALAAGTHTVTAYAGNTLDLEGSDRLEFTVSPGSAPPIGWTDYVNETSAYGHIGENTESTLENAIWLHSAADIWELTGNKAALKDLRIYDDDTMQSVVYEKNFIAGVRSAVIGDALDTFPDKTGYYAVLRDQLDNSTTMFFHLDKNGPTIEPAATAMVNGAGDGFYFNIGGVEKDDVSGAGSPIILMDVDAVVYSTYTPTTTYPAGPHSVNLNFTNITRATKFVFFDRSGWIGTYDMLLNNETQGLNISNYNGVSPDKSQVYGDSGVILRDAGIQVTGVATIGGPLASNIHLLDQPAGMAVELWAVSEDAALNANIPVSYGFAPVGSRKLFTFTGSGSDYDTFNIPMYRLGGIELVTGPNTNPVRYLEDIDTNGDGVYAGTQLSTFPPGQFRLKADATAHTAYSYLGGLEHFNKDIDLGPVRSARSGNVNIEIRNVTAGGNIVIESARYTLKKPGYKMANSDTLYEIKTTAQYDGPIYLQIGFCDAGFSDKQRNTATILHCDAGMNCSPVDTQVETVCWAKATVNNLSPFGVMVPIDDVTPPHTVMEPIGENVIVGVDLWVATETYISLNSNDDTGIGDISGVATTYYLLDIAPTPECHTAAYDPEAAYGTCANPLYDGAFTLNEGSYTVNYASVDNWDNYEQFTSKSIFVDGTSPRITFTVKGAELQTGETAYITWTDSITLTAVDPVSGGVASGVSATDYFIDADPDSCQTAPDLTGPAGTCDNPLYTGPFSLSVGTHTVYYTAADNVGNQAGVKSARVVVVGPAFPPGRPGAPSGTALGVSSISWNWSAAQYGQGYNIYGAADTASLIASTAAPAFAQTGLSSNTAYGIAVAGFNAGGQGPLSLTATTYTLAAPPVGTAVTGIWVTSAAISWGLNGNPPGTIAEVLRSTDSGSFARVFLGTAVLAAVAELEECTTYYLKARNLNGDGIYSGYDAAARFTTLGSTPAAAGGLAAESLAGGRIGLSWDFSPSAGVTQYRLYYGSATGTIDYNTPLAVFGSTETSWTTIALTPGAVYKFGLRTVNRCCVEEKNTSLFASAAALSSLTGVCAGIKVPQTGKHIKGNSVTVAAELLLGEPSGTRQVLFQYRVLGAALWTDIRAANAGHPNPASGSPYLVHWDVTAVPSNTYELRAAATDAGDTVDAAPPAITVVVDPVDFDINENSSGGRVEKEQKVNNAVTSTVQASDGDSALLTKVVIPPGALNTSTVTVTMVNNPALKPPAPGGADDLGMVTKIELSNGQTLLSGGKTAALTLNYKDDDENGVLDGTTVEADSLKMYTAGTASGPWVILPSSVDKAAKSVTGATPHFSFFAVFAVAAADLSAVRVYPNPFKPNGGDPDKGVAYSAGNPDSGIIFDNLTGQAAIKIYTVTGQLVAKLSSQGGGRVQWDAKNGSGHDAASGGYIAVITSPGHSAVVRKILIVR